MERRRLADIAAILASIPNTKHRLVTSRRRSIFQAAVFRLLKRGRQYLGSLKRLNRVGCRGLPLLVVGGETPALAKAAPCEKAA
nr:hypothetical protein [uncultured Kingella sp.]